MGKELGRSIKLLLDLLTGTDPRNRPFQNEREQYTIGYRSVSAHDTFVTEIYKAPPDDEKYTRTGTLPA